jgi:uncharacterized protein
MPMPTTVLRRNLDLAGLSVPVVELTGGRAGPLLTVLAGVHGCEYAAMAAVRRWAGQLEHRELAGRVRAVPIVNLPAFAARAAFVVPDDGKNLNRCFPGDPSGTLAERLADAVFTQLITGSDAVVDAHSGDLVEALVPFALYDAGPAEQSARELAVAYGLGYAVRQQAGPGRTVSGSTSAAAAAAGIPAIIAEAGGCGLVQPEAVAAHVRGLDRLLAALGMAAQQPADSPADSPAGDQAAGQPALLSGFRWLYCAGPGWWEPAVATGDTVAAGQLLGTVTSLDGATVHETISAPEPGVVLFLTTSPAVAADGLLLGLGTGGAVRPLRSTP